MLINYTTELLSKMKYSQSLYSFKARIEFSALVYLDLLALNGTSLIENQPSSIVATEVIKDLQTLQGEVLKLTLNPSLMKDPVINRITLHGGCEYLHNPYSHFYCVSPVNGPVESSLVERIGALIGDCHYLQTTYENSNKSSQVIADLLIKRVAISSPKTNSLNILSKNIANHVYYAFQKNINDGKTQNASASKVFYVLVVAECFLIYWFVLKHFMNIENKFKKLLQTVPVNLVLSNPMLRKYLHDISGKAFKGMLDEF